MVAADLFRKARPGECSCRGTTSHDEAIRREIPQNHRKVVKELLRPADCTAPQRLMSIVRQTEPRGAPGSREYCETWGKPICEARAWRMAATNAAPCAVQKRSCAEIPLSSGASQRYLLPEEQYAGCHARVGSAPFPFPSAAQIRYRSAESRYHAAPLAAKAWKDCPHYLAARRGRRSYCGSPSCFRKSHFW